MRSLLPDNVSMHTIMNTVLDGLIIIDKKGTIKSFNTGAVKIFGYEVEEVLGKNIKMLMPQPYRDEHDRYLSNFLSSHEAKIIGIGREVDGIRKNGEIFPLELGVNEMRINDDIMFVGTVRDISDRKKAEKDMESYIRALKHSNQELDDFAYIASHDLKEPLRGLSNNALFLKEDHRDSLSKAGIKRIDRMIYLAERMEQLIDDLLYFSRIGKQSLAIQETDLNIIIHEVTTMMETSLIDTDFEVRIPKPLPTITCDSLKIKEVFRNLITNALKYNDKEKKIIEIGCEDKKNEFVFYVKDNGIGIRSEFYKDIFRIFKRLNDEDDKIKGSGVGLTFVKKIIERHAGAIWLESAIGEGTTFYFTIPKRVEL